MTSAMILAGRVLLSIIFFLGGFDKITNVAGTAEVFAGFGLPMPQLVVVASAIFELAAASLLLIGFQTTIVALLLAAFSIASGFIGHDGQGAGDPLLELMNWQSFQKNLAMAGGFLVLAASGPGRYSVDHRRGRARVLEEAPVPGDARRGVERI